MRVRARTIVAPIILPIAVLIALLPHRAHAQEFAKQGVLIAPLHVDSTPGLLKAARQLAEVARSATAKLLDPREAEVIEQYRLENMLAASDYPRSAVLSEADIRIVGGRTRADEIVHGRVTSGVAGGVVVATRLAIVRNWGMQQPLPTIRAATPALAGTELAREVVKARAQFTGVRRCENALTRGDRPTAVREAERAIRAYAPAVIARDCLLAALLDGRTAADSVRRVADDVLALDSTNLFAAVSRAQALEAERRTADAATQWARVYTMQPDSLNLGRTVVDALLRLQRPALALTNATALRTRLGNDATLRRLTFRAQVALAQWPAAAALGDTLDREDDSFRTDSNYTTRYIEALRQTGDTLAALETSVLGIRHFPADGRLYLQYLQLVGMEQSAALPRGLIRFPAIPELHVMAAAAERRAGNKVGAIKATRAAIRQDPSRTPLYLQLADLFLDVNQPDSVVVALATAPRQGEQAALLRTYTVARGLMMLRTAGDTLPALQGTALTLLVLADSMESREDSRSYVAAAALQRSRAELLTASKSRSCPDVQRAAATLQLAASARDAGLGSGGTATEISAAYEAMRTAVDNGVAVLCKPPVPYDGITKRVIGS